MNKLLTKALNQEANTRAMLSAIKEEIRYAICESESLDGVTPHQSSVCCAVVKLSTIKDNDFNLSPYFYIQAAQADLVVRKLKSASTVTDFIDCIQEMVSKQRVRLSDGSTSRLNKKTVAVLAGYL